MIYFTSSWDDGSVYDLRLAELLNKYNINATFYIPINNIEGRSVITSSQIRDLSNNFEIGAHTINHVYLNRISNKEAKWEIEQSKEELELITGKQIYGFCFPGGKYKQVHIDMVYKAGFSYARTAKMLNVYNKNDFKLGTTLQVTDRSRFVYFRNLIKYRNLRGFLEFSSIVIANYGKWDILLTKILKKQLAEDSSNKIRIIHLWGHSFEIENNNQWTRLENFLKLINDYPIKTKTNYEITNTMLFK